MQDSEDPADQRKPPSEAFRQRIVNSMHTLVHDINNALGVALGNASLTRDALEGEAADIVRDVVDSIVLASTLVRLIPVYADCMPSGDTLVDVGALVVERVAAHNRRGSSARPVVIVGGVEIACQAYVEAECLRRVLTLLLQRVDGSQAITRTTSSEVRVCMHEVGAVGLPGPQIEIALRCPRDAVPSILVDARDDAWGDPGAIRAVREGVALFDLIGAVVYGAGGAVRITGDAQVETVLVRLFLPLHQAGD